MKTTVMTFLVATVLCLNAGFAFAETCREILMAPLPTNIHDLHDYYKNGGTDFEFNTRRGEHEENYFLRVGMNQSHTAVTSGAHAQIVTAYPAGNSGTALFAVGNKDLRLDMVKPPVAIETALEHGVRFTTQSNQSRLEFEYADVGSTRDIRDYEHFKLKQPDAMVSPQMISDDTVLFRRQRLDKKGYFSLKLKVLGGSVSLGANGHIICQAANGKPLQMVVESLTSEKPLLPLAANKIFKPEVLDRLSVEDIQSALYLFTADKIIAGSWRYQTYFGRDPLLTLIYSADYLLPEIFEVQLAAVFERMNAEGDAAHEEDIGDIATRRNIAAGLGPISKPLYDYKMVDTVYLVSALFDIYKKRVGDDVAAKFLKRKTSGGRLFSEALRANLNLALARSNAFADQPVYQNLISFKQGEVVGDWRDSGNGHGSTTDEEEFALKSKGIIHDRTQVGGRYSFGVNVGLVPSALRIASDVFNNQRLGLYDPTASVRAYYNLEIWNKYARSLFMQTVSAAEATTRAQQYLSEHRISGAAKIESPIHYSAIALDRFGQPIEVMHSDEGFDLLFNEPSEQVLNDVSDLILRPFPYGLSAPIGVVVANPMLVTDFTMRNRFKPDEYHAGVWGCDMAKLEQAFNKQLQRVDLSPNTRNKLLAAHQAIWNLLTKMAGHKKEELWSFKVVDGQITYAPYKEANALQTWNLTLSILTNPY